MNRLMLVFKLVGLMTALVWGQSTKRPPQQPLVTLEDGKLVIRAHENGDRIVDFSTAGYQGGGKGIPTIPAKLVVYPIDNDATDMINQAIEQVARLPVNEQGFRGAVLLAPGTYRISGQIKLNTSGVVLRGSGVDQTILLATGNDRRPLVKLSGTDDRTTEKPVVIQGSYVPAGAMTFTVPGHTFHQGDTVLITRPCTEEWIVSMKMDDFGGDRHGWRWNAGSRVLVWDRVITRVDRDSVTVDAPITFGLDSRFGGGSITRYTFPGRIQQTGIENLTLQSEYDRNNPFDEDHAWFGLVIDHAQDVWARRIVARHFTGGAIAVWNNAKRVTVEDCKSLEPIGEIGGWRRQAFIIEGQQVLMQRLWSENAVHDFAVGFAAAGPNVFSVCQSQNSLGDSGTIDSWAAGALFENVHIDGGDLSLRNLGYRKQCAGWSGVNSVLWNSSAGVIHCFRPPQGNNYAVGTNGEYDGDGIWWATDDGSPIRSLYYTQLAQRVGEQVAHRARLLTFLPEGSRRSTPQEASELVSQTRRSQQTVSNLIDQSIASDPLPIDDPGNLIRAEAVVAPLSERVQKTLSIKNGWLVAGQQIVSGSVTGVPWWNMRVRPPHVSKQPALTRFVPGKTGNGFTDDLQQVAESMSRSGIAGIVQHPPLWYERRRDDHQRVRRSDAEVVAPFYEWPFARSGQGKAYDGLSKWDLTKPNPYYYLRLREFAGLASQKGLILFNEHYMQHSILEAGAHYTDFPWRPANNVNDTGLPEPIAYAGDKLIYIGETFYDVDNNPRLRDLHRNYIRTQLDELKDCSNVVHLTGEEYTGSLRFVQFWVDVIHEWEQETGRDVKVGLYAPKDVTDAILEDPQRSGVIDLIFSRFNSSDAGFWYYGDNLYAPPGGKNLAPRQWQRQLNPGNASTSDVVRMIREYKKRYPDKAFVYLGNDLKEGNWQILLAGGSIPQLKLDPELAKSIARMSPVSEDMLADGTSSYLMYVRDQTTPLMTDSSKQYRRRYIDPKTGQWISSERPEPPYVLWMEEAP
ncbi:MAG: hypothetical protein KatS3mg104_0728 [Phycisphaerae bacterium]|jgi:hypothetical protein|nr:MAG: hypothetical protein KatS3mg104_0728 [Phycisphaerae bacterium]